MYNDHASQFFQKFEKHLDTTELDAFLTLLPLGAKVLDAGCGSGRDSAYFVSKGYDVLSVDASSRLLDESKKHHQELTTSVVDLLNPEFQSQSFNGIWCKLVILHMSKEEARSVVRHFFHALKPGGVVLLETKAGEGQGWEPISFLPSEKRLFTFLC